MADPANYGMAKGLIARAGGLEPGGDLDYEDAVAALMERMRGLLPKGVAAPRLTELVAMAQLTGLADEELSDPHRRPCSATGSGVACVQQRTCRNSAG